MHSCWEKENVSSVFQNRLKLPGKQKDKESFSAGNPPSILQLQAVYRRFLSSYVLNPIHAIGCFLILLMPSHA